MKKLIVVLFRIVVVVLFSVFAVPSMPSYAEDTTVSIGIASSGNVTANLGVTTPETANVSVGVNGGAGSVVNVNGVTPNQVSIGGANVGTTISNSSTTAANAVHASLQGVMFNEENYRMWIVPLQRRLNDTLAILASDESNINLTMDGLAKVIAVLQDQETRLVAQQQLLSQLTDNLSLSVSDKQRLQNELDIQFAYVDDQMQRSVDRDSQVLAILDARNKQLGYQIDYLTKSNDALAEKLMQCQERILSIEDDNSKSVWTRMRELPVVSHIVRLLLHE